MPPEDASSTIRLKCVSFLRSHRGSFLFPCTRAEGEEEEEGKVGGEEQWNVQAEGLCLVITPPRREGGVTLLGSRKPPRRRWISQSGSSFRKKLGRWRSPRRPSCADWSGGERGGLEVLLRRSLLFAREAPQADLKLGQVTGGIPELIHLAPHWAPEPDWLIGASQLGDRKPSASCLTAPKATTQGPFCQRRDERRRGGGVRGLAAKVATREETTPLCEYWKRSTHGSEPTARTPRARSDTRVLGSSGPKMICRDRSTRSWS